VEPTPEPPNFRRADELRFAELRALDLRRTLCVCAVSALEVHGPHLPIGADLHQAAWMADETGRRFAAAHPEWTVLRHPPLPIGADELPLPGSIESPARVVYRAVMALGESLARAGIRTVMVTNAHGGPRHAAALEAACRRVSRRRGIAMFTPSVRALHRLVTGQAADEVEAFLGRKLTDPERHGLATGEHAGTWETSWYLAMHPGWVDPGWRELAEDHPPPFAPLVRAAGRLRALGLGARPGGRGGLALPDALEALAGGIGWLRNVRSGYGRPPGAEPVSWSGWPALAAPDLGRAYAELSVRACLADLEAVVAGRVAAEQIRSIASDPPFIQPNFWRWLAAGTGAAALALRALL
jgi:creatinine amidohydrolase/Fe(II)-dependent formamide hydrolase-like protein